MKELKRKILYITGTRADYGLMKSVLEVIEEHPKIELEIVATGMHLMPEFGMSLKEIKKDGFKIHTLNATYDGDNKESMTDFIGHFIQLLTKKVKKIKPDIILLLGDRGEMLAGAIVGAYLTIPVAHLHGGEITSTVDESARHAITKLAHIHLPATKKSAERIIKMGEDPWRVHVVGAPGLDSVLNGELMSKEEVCRELGLNQNESILLVIQHPVTLEIEEAKKQMKETMETIKELKQQTIVIYPNADAGGRKMIRVIEQYRECPFIHIHRNLPHMQYLSLMKNADVLIGNSSSGVIEAPSFDLPTINIGTRQEGRERADNVIDVNYDKYRIIVAVRKALSKEFKEGLRGCRNPYGDGRTGKRAADILAGIKIDERLLQKKLTYLK